MTKHQSVNSQVIINDIELVKSTMTKEEFKEYIKSRLAGYLTDAILDSNIGRLYEEGNLNECYRTYGLSLVVIDPDDYKDLFDAIVRNNFKVIKDGEVTPLINLL